MQLGGAKKKSKKSKVPDVIEKSTIVEVIEKSKKSLGSKKVKRVNAWFELLKAVEKAKNIKRPEAMQVAKKLKDDMQKEFPNEDSAAIMKRVTEAL